MVSRKATKLGVLMPLLAVSLWASLALGQSGLLKRDYPERYVVQDGDTLWEIASQFLQNPERWPEIWQPDEYLDEPELIYPGDTLRLSIVEGSPRILVSRGDRNTVRLRPQMREEVLTSAIPAIALESVESSFSRNRIVSQQQFDEAPYIISNIGNNLAIGTGDEVYARATDWPTTTATFEIYRERRGYFGGEDDDELLGLELEYVGFATITDAEGEGIRRLLINNGSKEILIGDRLLIREESRIDSTIFPTEPGVEIQGEIVGFLNAENMASQLDSVVINLGIEDSLNVGDILSITQGTTELVDEVARERMGWRERLRATFRRDSEDTLELPGREIGTLLVYKTFDELSYALILSSLEPASIGSRVTNP